MPGACLSLWPSEECQWSLWDVWRWSDLIQRVIYLSLGLMLLYTLFVAVRFLLRYRLARLEFRRAPSGCASEPEASHHRDLIAGLSRGLETLRGMAYAAPLLALAGTSYGILAAPSWFHPHHRGDFINSLSQDFGTTLINTVLGILVAISATISHNAFRICIETLSRRWLPRRNSSKNGLGLSQFAQTLPLRKRFSRVPHFALLAAPVLACPLMTYLAFKPYPIPKGLPVHAVSVASLQKGDAPEPVVVSVLQKPDGSPMFRVNSKEIPLEKLKEVVTQKLQGRAEAVAYIQGDSAVPWAYVAYAIDEIQGPHCLVVLPTGTPPRKVLATHTLERYR